ncbi:hypothetical protein GCM10022419_121000 [Nonomuraea rosea]|uniref:Uncharacterized protein n=1 Tax=Nonomuraea rosea TaxID=638574 RepID=A0ABP6ZRX3_9ACTN
MSHREQRTCPVCATLFTWNSSRPTHRFCDPRCKAIWAREMKKARELGLPPPVPGDIRLRPGPAARARDPRAHDRHLHGDPLPEDHLRGEGRRGDLVTAATTNARQSSCPHCRKPIAVVAMLVPPAAVHVDTPSQSVTNIN